MSPFCLLANFQNRCVIGRGICAYSPRNQPPYLESLPGRLLHLSLPTWSFVMLNHLWQKWSFQSKANRKTRRKQAVVSRVRLNIEQLEDRTVPSTTVLSTFPLLTTFGQNASLTATVSDGANTPTTNNGASVHFFDNGTPISGTVNYSTIGNTLQAMLVENTLKVGTHNNITASYSGDGTAASSTTATPATETVNYKPGDLIASLVGTNATSTISTISESGTTATVTTATPHNLLTGQAVTIAGTSIAGYNTAANTTYTITVTSGTTFTFTATAGLAASTGGTAALALNGTAAATVLQDYTGSTLNAGNTVALPLIGSSVGITSATESGTTVTVTTSSAHGFSVGQQVTIAGAGLNGFNGIYTIATAPTANTFTFIDGSGLNTASIAAASVASGTVTITTATTTGFTVGQQVTIAGITGTGYNGTYTIASIVSGTKFTYADSGASGTATTTGATATISSATGGTATVATNAVTEKGTGAGEGYLGAALDGQTVAIAGYKQLPGYSVGTSNSGVNNVIAQLSPNGIIDTSTQINAADYSGGFTPAIRAVASADGEGFFVASGHYIQYVPFGNAPGVSVGVTSAVANSTTSATVTTATAVPGLVVGSTVQLEGVSLNTTGSTSNNYNGTFVVTAVSGNSFSFVTSGLTVGSSGNGAGGSANIPSSIILSNFYSNPTAVTLSPAEQIYLDGSAGGSTATGVPPFSGPVPIGTGAPVTGQQGGLPLQGAGFVDAKDLSGGFPSPNQFVVSPDGNTIYTADSRVDSLGGIEKFVQNFAHGT